MSETPFRIGFFGGGRQALACLRRIAERSEYAIAFVHPRETEDPELFDFCAGRHIAILEGRNVNDPATLERIGAAGIDLAVSVNAKQIFGPAFLALPAQGAINVHNGLLPRQRGGGGAYTAIINGETPGTTVHFIDEGIDTGDIVAQAEIPLGPDETMGDFQGRAVGVSVDLLVSALDGIRTGTARRTPQKDSPFHYTPKKAPWDELVDWSEPSRTILDKIRARRPGPANFYVYEEEIFEIVEAAAEPALVPFRNTTGQVLQRQIGKGVLVKTGDSGLWVTSVRRKGTQEAFVPKHPAGAMLRYMVGREIYELKARLAALEARLGDRDRA